MIKKLIRYCRISLLGDDSAAYPNDQVVHNEVPINAYRFSPYGLSSRPPLDALGLMLSPGCRNDSPVVLIDQPLERFKNLKPGEVKVGNYQTKAEVHFDQAGNIVITPKSASSVKVIVDGGGNVDIEAPGANINLTAATVAITGNLTVSGTISATGDIVGATKSLSTHTHPYLDNGSPSTTSPPT